MPLKINMGGVIPVIFASSVFQCRRVSLLRSAQSECTRYLVGQNLWLSRCSCGRSYYELIFLSLIIFFTFFYVSIVFNVEEVADNLRKHGGLCRGLDPAGQTASI